MILNPSNSTGLNQAAQYPAFGELESSGAFIKIGYFENEADLIFQDEVHGNLFEQVEKTIGLLFTKYIKAIISYEGIYRVETYEYPKEAIRECLLNSVAHKDPAISSWLFCIPKT